MYVRMQDACMENIISKKDAFECSDNGLDKEYFAWGWVKLLSILITSEAFFNLISM